MQLFLLSYSLQGAHAEVCVSCLSDQALIISTSALVFILKAQLGIAACSGRYFAAVLIWACSDLKV